MAPHGAALKSAIVPQPLPVAEMTLSSKKLTSLEEAPNSYEITRSQWTERKEGDHQHSKEHSGV